MNKAFKSLQENRVEEKIEKNKKKVKTTIWCLSTNTGRQVEVLYLFC